MKMKVLSLAVMSALMSVANAQAEGVTFTAEPYVGYTGLGGMTANTPASSTSAGSLSGAVLGARGLVGFADLFFAGPDFSYSFLSYSAPSTSSYSGESLSSVNSAKLGLVAGIELPKIPFRFWVGYNFLDKLSATDSTGSLDSSTANSSTTFSGGSFKVGAGYKFLPVLSVNLEFLASSYTSQSTGGLTTNYASGNSITNTAFILSASAPLTF